MAKLKDGFYKLTASSIGSDLLVLLAGGGAKPISDFASAFNVKLWGNTFNGSSDVNGAIQFATAGNTGLIKFLNGEFIDGYGNFHLGSNSTSWNVFDNNQNYLLTILKSGNVGIGTTTPEYTLDVNGTIRAKKSIESIALNDGYWSGGIRIDGTETIRPSVGFHIPNLYGRRLFMEETKGDLMWECSSTSGKPTYYILHSGNYLTFASKMYWANVLISSTSNATTKPTFSNTIVNGLLSVNGGIKTLAINHNHTLSTAWNDFIACLNPNLTATYHTAHITFGRTYDSKNVGYIGFKYAGNASNSNMVTIGLHSVDNVLNVLASGNVGIGTLTPSLKLDVVGSIQSSDTVYGKAITAVGNTVGPYLPNINWFDLTKNVGFHVSYRLNETTKPLRFYYKNGDTFNLLLDIESSGLIKLKNNIVFTGSVGSGAGTYLAGTGTDGLFLAANESGKKVFLESTNQSSPWFRNKNGDYAIWHSGNDGSGSGLDADLLDGRQFSSSFTAASDITWDSLMWTASGGCSDISTMGYAAVMNVGTDLYRGWLIWNSRNDHKLYWRPVKSDASSWADVHVLLDSFNYTTYCAPASHSHSYYPLSGNVNMSGDNVWIGSTMGGGTDYWRIGGTGSSDNGVCQLTIGDNSNDYFQIIIADYTGTNYTALLVKNGGTYAPHFYENSDQRLKENIQAIFNKDNIPQIKEFDWKESGEHSYGLIAQELEDLGYPELVSTKDDGYKTVNYSAALSLIVGKLQVKIKELEKEIEILKNKN